MKKGVNPLPEGFHTLQPVINVPDIDAVILFIQQAFDAVEINRFTTPEGATAHVELKIGDSPLALGPPDHEGAYPAKLFVYVENVDQVIQKAVEAGGELLMEPTQQFYGQRVGRVKDRQGNLWVIATQTELVSREEMQRRFKALFSSSGS